MPRGVYKRSYMTKAGRKAISDAQKARWAKKRLEYYKQVRDENVETVTQNITVQHTLPLATPIKASDVKFEVILSAYENATSYSSVVDAYLGGFIDGYKTRRDEK